MNNEISSLKPGITMKRRVGSVIATAWFAFLGVIINFSGICGTLASFRPRNELIRRGLSINLDVSTMTLGNYIYLFSGNADSVKYFNWFKNAT